MTTDEAYQTGHDAALAGHPLDLDANLTQPETRAYRAGYLDATINARPDTRIVYVEYTTSGTPLPE